MNGSPLPTPLKSESLLHSCHIPFTYRKYMFPYLLNPESHDNLCTQYPCLFMILNRLGWKTLHPSHCGWLIFDLYPLREFCKFLWTHFQDLLSPHITLFLNTLLNSFIFNKMSLFPLWTIEGPKVLPRFFLFSQLISHKSKTS